jgi:actin related protein 2/3 complex subunit 1A/1B
MSLKTADVEKGIAEVITAHAFSPDGKQIALCANTPEVHIYDCSAGPDTKTWVKLHTVAEHTAIVSGIDWNTDNKIVTASHDRNAYVWTYHAESNEWKPTMCLLHINRAATGVVWSPCQRKFAVPSGSKQVAICTHEAASDWWSSKMVRKNHRSTILTAAFSPNSQLIVTAGTDYKCRIVSIFDKALDAKTGTYDAIFGENPALYTFGETLAEFDEAGGWVNAAAWSPSGTRLCFVGHGSTIHFVDLSVSTTAVQTISLRDLPFLQVEFLSDNTVVAAGFDRNPAFFTYNGSKWVSSGYAETEAASKAAAAAATPVKSATSAAFAKFQQADYQGGKFGEDIKASKKPSFTTHSNTITCLKRDKACASKFTTSGLDGKITFWDATKYVSV